MSKQVTKSVDYALELENISKSFDNNFDVIKDISLKVRKGELIILGISEEKIQNNILTGFIPILQCLFHN